jgi:sodium/bile acid cotransporter 7
LIVLAPFLAGMAAKVWAPLDPKHWTLQYLPSMCIILTVWMALSDSSELFQSLEIATLLKIAAATLLLHFTLMLLSFILSNLLKLEARARLAMLFTLSQKTLPVAISVLAALDAAIGEAVLACVLFHFLMLFSDSMLAPRLKLQSRQ